MKEYKKAQKLYFLMNTIKIAMGYLLFLWLNNMHVRIIYFKTIFIALFSTSVMAANVYECLSLLLV